MAYNTTMRFEVPQFIEIEDKIFGPFTWKQFVYLAGGVGVAVVIFLTTNFFFFVLIGAPIGGLAVLLAFYPVYNRPFADFLESMVFFYNNSRVYHWRKKSNIVYKGRSGDTEVLTTGRTFEQGGITSLARKLELNALQKEE